MKKIICFFTSILILGGCATAANQTCKLNLGASKKEIVARCGKPYRTCAIIDQDGKLLETYMYKQVPTPDNVSYVYFLEGKVIRYGVKSSDDSKVPSNLEK